MGARIVVLGPDTTWVRQDVELLKSEGFDVIYIRDNILHIFKNIKKIIDSDIILEWFAYPVGSFLGKVLNKKVILNAIGWELFEFGFACNPWRRFLIKIGLKNADIIIAISRKSLKLAENYYRHNNTKIIYEGIDTGKFSSFKKKNTCCFYKNKQVIVITHLDLIHIVRKDLITLIRSIKHVSEIYSDIKLVIVGKITKDVKYLLNIIDQLDIINNIQFTGFVNDNKLLDLINNSNLFVLPSLYEGFPTVLCEALSCGLPIATVNRPTMNEIFKNGVHAMIVEPRNPRALANAIVYLLQNPAKSLKITVNGTKLVRYKYSNKIRAEKLKKLITKLLSTNNTHSNKSITNILIYFILFILALTILYLDRKKSRAYNKNVNSLTDCFLSV